MQREEPLNSSFLVVGLGRSGIAAAKLLKSEGHQVIVLEKRDEALFSEISSDLRNKGIDIKFGKALEIENFKPWLNQLKAVVISPGIRWDHPTLNNLRKQKILVQGEMGLAWQRLKHIPWVAITGTNGKTTVTHMLSHVLRNHGLNAPMGGNMGNSASEIAIKNQSSNKKSPEWLIMELSSYQIEAASDISPRIGIWTNLTPDHLERHGTLDAYRKIKRGLLERSDIPIFNGDDPDLIRQRSKLKPGIWTSIKGPSDNGFLVDLWINSQGELIEQGEKLFNINALKIPGEHNLQNLLLVTAAARQIGVPPEMIKKSISSFKGVPHRLEKLGSIEVMNVFNDSKATNYDSAMLGLKTVPSPIVLIAGGQTKKGNASEWLRQIELKACSVVLFGSGAKELADLIKTSHFHGEICYCKNLKQAVDMAIEIGIKQKAISLLLSPACASFDQYPDFEQRGNHFKKLIEPLLTSKHI